MRIIFTTDSIQEDDEFEVESDCVPRVGESVIYGDHEYEAKYVFYRIRDGQLYANVITDKVYHS